MKKEFLVAAAVFMLMAAPLATAGVITPYNAHGSSRYSTSYDFDLTIDGSGLTVNDPFETSTHTSGGTVAANLYWLSSWVADFGDGSNCFLQFDLDVEDTPYSIAGMLLWNMNEVYLSGGNVYDQTDRGIKEMDVLLSVDNDATNGDGVTDDIVISYRENPVTGQFGPIAKGPGSDDYHADAYDFGQTYSGIRFVQFNILSNHGFTHANGLIAALAEVRFVGEPVPEPAAMVLLGLGGLVLLRRRG